MKYLCIYFLIYYILPLSQNSNVNNLKTPFWQKKTVECFELAPHQNEVLYLAYKSQHNPSILNSNNVFRKEDCCFTTSRQFCLD